MRPEVTSRKVTHATTLAEFGKWLVSAIHTASAWFRAGSEACRGIMTSRACGSGTAQFGEEFGIDVAAADYSYVDGRLGQVVGVKKKRCRGDGAAGFR